MFRDTTAGAKINMAAHVDNLEITCLDLKNSKNSNLKNKTGYDESHFNIINVTLEIF